MDVAQHMASLLQNIEAARLLDAGIKRSVPNSNVPINVHNSIGASVTAMTELYTSLSLMQAKQAARHTS